MLMEYRVSQARNAKVYNYYGSNGVVLRTLSAGALMTVYDEINGFCRIDPIRSEWVRKTDLVFSKNLETSNTNNQLRVTRTPFVREPSVTEQVNQITKTLNSNYKPTSVNENYGILNKTRSMLNSVSGTLTSLQNQLRSVSDNGVQKTSGINGVSYSVKKTTGGTSISSLGKDAIFISDRVFGSPFQYTEVVDPPSIDGVPVGRKYVDEIVSPNMVISIAPGTVNYLTELKDDDKQKTLLNAIACDSKNAGSSVVDEALHLEDGGLFYKFKTARAEYMRYVNMLCRIMAVYMNIGDKKFKGSGATYRHMDWGNYQVIDSDEPYNNGRSFSNMFSATSVSEMMIGKGTYTHFYGTASTTASEDISVTTRSSAIEELFNSKFSEGIKDFNFLTGGLMDGMRSDMQNDIDRIVQEVGGNSFITNLLHKGVSYLTGARLIFPQMIDDVTYGKSFDVTSRFVSPYGDAESRFLYTLVPLAHIMPYVFPKQVDVDMYTYPFLARVFSQGNFSCDMAVISNLRITRGGPDNTSWTIDANANEIEVVFTVTPLYSKMMITESEKPFLFMNNTALHEYLGTICGVDMRVDNGPIKWNAWRMAVENGIGDIPINIGRKLFDTTFAENVRAWFNLP